MVVECRGELTTHKTPWIRACIMSRGIKRKSSCELTKIKRMYSPRKLLHPLQICLLWLPKGERKSGQQRETTKWQDTFRIIYFARWGSVLVQIPARKKRSSLPLHISVINVLVSLAHRNVIGLLGYLEKMCHGCISCRPTALFVSHMFGYVEQ
jgi:hypothetical protein